METKKILIEDREHIEDALLMEAAQILREGGLVAFPTETVYGLGGNALDEKASEKIYAAKGRPSDNPLIAHVSCIEEVEPLVSRIPEAGRRLMEAYWPGPLTLIFPKSSQVPYATTGRFGDSCHPHAQRPGGAASHRPGRRPCGCAQRQHIGPPQPHNGSACVGRSRGTD